MNICKNCGKETTRKKLCQSCIAFKFYGTTNADVNQAIKVHVNFNFLTLRKGQLTEFECVNCQRITQRKFVRSRLDKYKKCLCNTCMRKETFLVKYGVEHVLQSSEIQQKLKQTCIERYGYESSNQADTVKKKKEETYLQKYGVRSLSQNKQIRQKQMQTTLQRHGVTCGFNKPEVREKLKELTQTAEVKQKRINTCIKNWGVKHPLQHHELLTKARRKYKYHNEVFDSSWELAYWIWANDNNISIKRNTVSFQYNDNGIERTFTPDFVINNDKLIEIKSLFIENKQNQPMKRKVCKQNNITILMNDEMKPILNYIASVYGKKYLRQFKTSSGL